MEVVIMEKEEYVIDEKMKELRQLIKDGKSVNSKKIDIGGKKIVDVGFSKKDMRSPKRNIPVLKRGKNWEAVWSLENESFFEADPMGRLVPYTDTVSMSPEFAWKLFSEINFRNRNVDMSKVKYYISLIQKDLWHNTHQGMAIYEDGSLSDGQHRLLAIGYCNKNVTLKITSGILLEASNGIDIGKKRTTRDIAIINGHDDFTTSMIKTASWLTSKKINQKGTEMSPEEQIKFCDDHMPAILAAERTDKHAVVRAAFAACWEFSLETKRYDEYNNGDSKSRLEELQEILRGESRNNKKENSAAVSLWKKSMNKNAKREFSAGNNQTNGYYKAEKAMDCFMRREPLYRLSLTKGERVERFPTADQLEKIKSCIE